MRKSGGLLLRLKEIEKEWWTFIKIERDRGKW